MTPENMACRGAATIERDGHCCEHMVECEACGTRVRWDLADHSFYGFAASCTEAPVDTPTDGGSAP